MMNDFLDYDLPSNAYANFDALSLKQFIIDKLNESSTFTDQNYEGSNLASFIDIIAYSYHVLLFYLNKNSSESLFSQATIYDNINRIVKTLNYKPSGKRTSLLTTNCLAKSNLSTGNYTIKKYSYILADNIQYTTIRNFSFSKTLQNSDEKIDSIEKELIFYQGSVNAYPLYTAEGLDYETITVVFDPVNDTTDGRFIADGTISVYVKEKDSGGWFEYTESDNIYLNGGDERIYDLRLNENKHYEIKFGNDVLGRKLKNGDIVAIYYVLSDGERGIISPNTIKKASLITYNTTQFNEIYADTNITSNVNFIDKTNSSYLQFDNANNSTSIANEESVDDIKNNVPVFINNTIRLSTEDEYDKFVLKNMSNFIISAKSIGNEKYINDFIGYYKNLGVNDNIILNNFNLSNYCNFNNVNLFCVPKFTLTEDEDYPPLLSNALKKILTDTISKRKIISHEIIPRDPVYIAFEIGCDENVKISESSYNNSYIEIIRDSDIIINKDNIKANVIKEILNFFDPVNNKLGGRMEFTTLNSKIMNIKGISSVKTIDGSKEFGGVSFVSWNPKYPDFDVSLHYQNTTLPFFKFPYLYRPNNITNKIIIKDNE